MAVATKDYTEKGIFIWDFKAESLHGGRRNYGTPAHPTKVIFSLSTRDRYSEQMWMRVGWFPCRIYFWWCGCRRNPSISGSSLGCKTLAVQLHYAPRERKIPTTRRLSSCFREQDARSDVLIRSKQPMRGCNSFRSKLILIAVPRRIFPFSWRRAKRIGSPVLRNGNRFSCLGTSARTCTGCQIFVFQFWLTTRRQMVRRRKHLSER